MNYMILDFRQTQILTRDVANNYMSSHFLVGFEFGFNNRFIEKYKEIKIINFKIVLSEKKNVEDRVFKKVHTLYKLDLMLESHALTSFFYTKDDKNSLKLGDFTPEKLERKHRTYEEKEKENSFLSMGEAIKKLKKLTSESKFCFFNFDFSPVEELLIESSHQRNNLIYELKKNLDHYFFNALAVLKKFSEIKTDILKDIHTTSSKKIKQLDELLFKLEVLVFLNRMYLCEQYSNAMSIIIRNEANEIWYDIGKKYDYKIKSPDGYRSFFPEDRINQLIKLLIYQDIRHVFFTSLYNFTNNENPYGECKCCSIFSLSEKYTLRYFDTMSRDQESSIEIMKNIHQIHYIVSSEKLSCTSVIDKNDSILYLTLDSEFKITTHDLKADSDFGIKKTFLSFLKKAIKDKKELFTKPKVLGSLFKVEASELNP